MAEYGEWNRKGATLSDKTARKEYGVDQNFIERGIRGGQLEYRQGSVWGTNMHERRDSAVGTQARL